MATTRAMTIVNSQLIGQSMRDLAQSKIRSIIFLKFQPVSHLECGKKKDGYTKMTRGGGFSGIVGIIMDDVCQKKTSGKLRDGKRFDVMPDR